MTETNQDWKAWAKETAPTPTDDGWARVEHFVETWNNIGGGLTERLIGKRSHYINIGGVLPFSIEKARALLAHLNEVATGLSEGMRWVLLATRKGEPSHPFLLDIAGYGSGVFASARALAKRGLLRPFGPADPKTASEWCATPFGRAIITRVLETDRG